MNFDAADRRRVAIATIITLVALPSIWLMSRDDPTGPATVTPAGVAVTPDTTAGERPARPDPMGRAGAGFLDGPEVPIERPEGEPVAIAVPAPPRGTLVTSRATFRSTIPNESVCLVAEAPFSARVRVTNVDNGRSITCIASVNPIGSADAVVLHTDAFTRISELSEAPIPVELSW